MLVATSQGPWVSPGIHLQLGLCEIFGLQDHFHDLSSNHVLHLHLSRLSSFFRDFFLFRNPSYWHQLFFPALQALSFPHLNCLHAEVCDQTPNQCFWLMILLIEELRTRHFCLVQLLPKFTSNLHWLQPASRRFLLRSSAAPLGTLTHAHKGTLMAFTVQSIFSSMTVIPPHTRQCHLKTRNTVFCSCSTHLRERQFLLQRLILMTLDEHFSAQSGTTVVHSHMVVSLLYMVIGSQKTEKLPFSLLRHAYKVVLGNFLGAGRFGSLRNWTNISYLLPEQLSEFRSD